VAFSLTKLKTEQDDMSVFDIPATLNAPVLSIVFEIARGPSIATVQRWQTYCTG
jgi:hypothetical protein